MAILKQRASELAIHGGGPPTFDSKVALFSPHVGNSQKFSALAERMFLSGDNGDLASEFEISYAEFVGVSRAIAFSSIAAAMAAVAGGLGSKICLPALGAHLAPLPANSHVRHVDCASGASIQYSDSDDLTLRIDHFGLNSSGDDAEQVAILGHQSVGSRTGRERFGSDCRLSIAKLGRDQVLHALDAAVITTDDELLAYKIQSWRDRNTFELNPTMSDASAAMGLANLDSVDDFVLANEERYAAYAEYLSDIAGVRLLAPQIRKGWNHQAIVLDVRQGEYGNSRNGLYHNLLAENIGAGRPFEEDGFMPQYPLASASRERLLQLPNGPGLTGEMIKAICQVVRLSAVSGLESPDPIRLAA